jgi:hypothetical protein
MQDIDVAVALIRRDAGENLVDGALFAFERLQKCPVVEDQHAADAERPVAFTGAEQKLSQICRREAFSRGTRIDNLMHARPFRIRSQRWAGMH